jgi:ABC-type glycerol-3-phosphate transport system substrate-binding protein
MWDMSTRVIAIIIGSLGLFGCGAGAVGATSVREPVVGSSADGTTTTTAHTVPAATRPAADPGEKKEPGDKGQDIDWLSRMAPQ